MPSDLSISDFARELGISTTSVRAMIQRRTVAFYTLPPARGSKGATRIPRSEVGRIRNETPEPSRRTTTPYRDSGRSTGAFDNW